MGSKGAGLDFDKLFQCGYLGLDRHFQGCQECAGTSFGGILGDFGGACLTLGIHVSTRWQWGTGIDAFQV